MTIDWKQLVPTRRSLLSRIKNWDDQKSWGEFHEIYRPLIRGAAIKAGLTETEAEDATQDTLIAVAKAIREFNYDPQKCAFKTWLHAITRRQVANQFRKRQGHGRVLESLEGERGETVDGESSLVDDIPDPASLALEEAWEREWEQNLKDAAVQRVQNRVSPTQFQIFDYHELQGHSVAETARVLGINPAQVYLAKHRILIQVRAEVQLLKAREEQMWNPKAEERRANKAKD
jgi:RNA polymerase sigma factor (sigma-70 family)